MSKPGCCEAGTSQARRGIRRSTDIAGTVIPAAILVLLPKCPACLVAWLAMGTGIGVTMSTSAYLRTLLLMVCAGCLIYLATRHVFRWIAVRRTL